MTQDTQAVITEEVKQRLGVAAPVDDAAVETFYPPIPPNLLDPTGTHSAPSILPGFQGLPFRGKIPNLKEDDAEFRQPQSTSQLFIRVFDLSKKEDLAYYEKVCQLVANGFATVSVEEKVYDDSIHSWRVLLRWMIDYAYVKKDV